MGGNPSERWLPSVKTGSEDAVGQRASESRRSRQHPFLSALRRCNAVVLHITGWSSWVVRQGPVHLVPSPPSPFSALHPPNQPPSLSTRHSETTDGRPCIQRTTTHTSQYTKPTNRRLRRPSVASLDLPCDSGCDENSHAHGQMGGQLAALLRVWRAALQGS